MKAHLWNDAAPPELRGEPDPPDAVEELKGLLKEAGLVPYFHDQDCAMWRGGECDRYCAPHVCPGCHAVGPERCAPGCIDDEIRGEAENELEMQVRWKDEDDDG